MSPTASDLFLNGYRRGRVWQTRLGFEWGHDEISCRIGPYEVCGAHFISHWVPLGGLLLNALLLATCRTCVRMRNECSMNRQQRIKAKEKRIDASAGATLSFLK